MKNKRGQLGINLSKGFLLGILSLMLIGIAFLIVIKQVGNTSIVSSDTDVGNIIANGTSATSSFFSNVPTWFGLLALVVLIAIVVVVIQIVNGLGGRSSGL